MDGLIKYSIKETNVSSNSIFKHKLIIDNAIIDDNTLFGEQQKEIRRIILQERRLKHSVLRPINS